MEIATRLERGSRARSFIRPVARLEVTSADIPGYSANPLGCTIVTPSQARIVRSPITRADLQEMAAARFGDMVKAVVDTERAVVAVSGELHSDEEALLLEDGSRQVHLWGINLYPDETSADWIEFDSMINVRPSQNNRSRTVEDATIRARIREIVRQLVSDA
jgi:hypothetical protein